MSWNMVKVAAGIAGVVLVIVFGWWLVTEPGRQREKAAEAEVRGSVANAGSEAGQVAVNAVSTNAQEKAGIDAQVKGGQDELEASDPSEWDAITRRRMCQSPSYRGTDVCL